MIFDVSFEYPSRDTFRGYIIYNFARTIKTTKDDKKQKKEKKVRDRLGRIKRRKEHIDETKTR